MRDPLVKYPGYSLRRAAHAMAVELSGRLAELDLRLTDASTLLLIAENSGITASALCRQLDMQPANMVPLLKRLEESGLIARTPIDKRSQGLTLTSLGRGKVAAAVKVIDKFEGELLERVPKEHRAHLLPVLDALWR